MNSLHPQVYELKELYEQLDDRFDDVYAKANTPEQKQALKDNLTAARLALLQALNRSFDQNNHLVISLTKGLHERRTALTEELRSIRDFVGVLQLMTESVQLASGLAGLVL